MKDCSNKNNLHNPTLGIGSQQLLFLVRKKMSQLSFDFDEHQESSIPKTSSVGECINAILSADIEPPNIIVPNFLVSGEATMLAALAGGQRRSQHSILQHALLQVHLALVCQQLSLSLYYS